MKLRVPTLFILALLLVAGQTSAQTTFTWQATSNPDVAVNSNWVGGVAPAGNGTENFIFGSSASLASVTIGSAAFGVNNITFNGGSSRPAYVFSGVGGPPTRSLTIAGQLTAAAGADVLFDSSLNVNLTDGSHTVNIAGTTVTVAGNISNYATGPSSIAKAGSGTLVLSGANTFTGGIAVNAGKLILASDTGAGSGTISLASGSELTATGSRDIANAVSLASGSERLNIVDSSNDSLTLSGIISGSGVLNLYGDAMLTLSGSNTGWTGGLSIFGNNTVRVSNANALGLGGLVFSANANATVEFQVDATIRSLSGVSDPAIVLIDDGKTLTINQNTNTSYSGFIKDNNTSGGNLLKTGSGTLTLSNVNTYHGATTINGGALVADGTGDNSNQLGSGAVTIGSGGNLTLNRTTLNNSTVAVNGRITGSGTINGNTTVYSGGVLAPGFASGTQVSSLTFDDLTLRGGGILEWNLQDPNGDVSAGPGTAYDLISISGVLHSDYTSVNPTTPFTIKLISLNGSGSPGTVTGFLNQSYTWTVFDGGSSAIDFGAGSFNPNSFILNTSAFSSDAVAGSFAVVQNGNLLQITFTPVPEPSTWVMLLGGAGVVGWIARRRRNA